MVKLLQKVMQSVVGFTFYFLCWVYVFALVYNVMGMSFNDDEYKNMDNFAVILIQSFRISLADLAVPDYRMWSG